MEDSLKPREIISRRYVRKPKRLADVSYSANIHVLPDISETSSDVEIM